MTESRLRVQRLIQMSGLTSRRTAETWIEAGRVSVNGLPATIGQTCDPVKDVILVDGRPLPKTHAKAYWMVNKPVGYTCSLKDRHAEHLVTELVPADQGRLYPIGRLDRDSQGLLLMTNDGDLAFKLSHPRSQIPKVYEVWVEGTPRRHRLDRITRGIQFDDGLSRPASVDLIRSEGKKSVLRIVLTEGKKREIRRLMAIVGHPVIGLTRVAYANLSLSGLASGKSRPLTAQEIASLQHSARGRTAGAEPEDPKSKRPRSANDRERRPKPSVPQPNRKRMGVSSGKPQHRVGHPQRNRGRTHR